MTPCTDVYKANIKSDGRIESLKLRTVVRGDFQNKEMIVDTWYPAALMKILKYFLADYANRKARLHQLYLVGACLQANLKYIIFLKLYSRYVEYFLDCANYFGRPLSLKKSMYGMMNDEKLFADEITNWLIDKAGLNQSRCQMYVY